MLARRDFEEHFVRHFGGRGGYAVLAGHATRPVQVRRCIAKRLPSFSNDMLVLLVIKKLGAHAVRRWAPPDAVRLGAFCQPAEETGATFCVSCIVSPGLCPLPASGSRL